MAADLDPFDGPVLPHSLEAEKSILGAILLHGEVLEEAAEHVQAAHFYREAHRTLFAHMVTLAGAHVEIDLTTLRESLSTAGRLADVGGAGYITSLVDGLPRSTNVANYARIVREKFELRQVIAAADRLLKDAYGAQENAREVIDTAEQALFEIATGAATGRLRRLSEIVPGLLEQIEIWCSMKQGLTGIGSGFRDLDDMTRGFQPGNLILIAARPSMGKSSLMLNIAQHVARGDKTVALFSLEMSDTELAIRTLTAEAHIDGHRLQRGYVRDAEWSRLAAAMARLGDLNLFIDESPFITAFEMRSRARRLKAQHGLSLLIVDYTQLMIGQESDRKENRTLELGAISRALKALAKDLKIPVIALSQLSRRCEERTDKRPLLSDLRESGALEQDADLVMFIYREAVYKETDDNRGRAELIIAKQRNGPIGTVQLGWIPEETRFVNLDEVHRDTEQDLLI